MAANAALDASARGNHARQVTAAPRPAHWKSMISDALPAGRRPGLAASSCCTPSEVIDGGGPHQAGRDCAKPGARVERAKFHQIDLHWHDSRDEGECRVPADGVSSNSCSRYATGQQMHANSEQNANGAERAAKCERSGMSLAGCRGPRHSRKARPAGFEPATPGLEGRRHEPARDGPRRSRLI
jgi:hypothetical protein